MRHRRKLPRVGSLIWFSEAQRDGSQKDPPAIVLRCDDDRLVIVRGTSQQPANDTGKRWVIEAGTPTATRLGLTYTTTFQGRDIKVIRKKDVRSVGSTVGNAAYEMLVELFAARVQEFIAPRRRPSSDSLPAQDPAAGKS